MVYGRILLCIFLLVPVEVLRDALQPNFQLAEDKRLRALLQDLPTVLLKSKADSTARKYKRGFDTWRKRASQSKEIDNFLLLVYTFHCFFLA